MKALGEYLKSELARRGWVAEDFAWRAGLRASSIYRITTGQRQNPRLDTLEKIARGLGLTVPELCDRLYGRESTPEAADGEGLDRDNANRITPKTTSYDNRPLVLAAIGV